MVKEIECLAYYDYPVINTPEILQRNAKVIVGMLSRELHLERLNFVGIGTSGAMIMTAISQIAPQHIFTILRKEGEHTHRSTFSDFERMISEGLPIVIVDDKIASGKTFNIIHSLLKQSGMIERVEVIAVNTASNIDLAGMFSNLKLIIT